MVRSLSFGLLALMFTGAVLPASALSTPVPAMMNYQGLVTDSEGPQSLKTG